MKTFKIYIDSPSGVSGWLSSEVCMVNICTDVVTLDLSSNPWSAKSFTESQIKSMGYTLDRYGIAKYVYDTNSTKEDDNGLC